ncbi:hypothetical protein PHYBLDRAFT_142934 [Phycomyces blakesleeanus NRRL 1555(-)]|uniref:Uncharacterized protein n=1 Tax=Phycomyces blakesleeanus (strain ATCC 8743b / DSM 1359 / FGSC 10004 / NBRC 33097 / NRRL 1555) TaxID=763407 RepID=A0A163AUR8_PHYB8|nr:hypothetical protein PHYBLDRAFT_142934 [Phycomyces blakesleeanus NRRL 1555(-)]OAD75951.1 hypothetical protein PHYBLDRAFT_142934 [Phycomyces blakesleeanus NRRL 1555(-)]|eukprot:XP_018293991.1 hypothetical protein PHYBLDRAFT_142934 [Phycomyces blakesleeanus NRRL 1555(-)]
MSPLTKKYLPSKLRVHTAQTVLPDYPFSDSRFFIMYNRAKAACKASGVPMLQENGDQHLAMLDQAGLDVVYVEESGDKRPVIMGKGAIIRDCITYMKYVAAGTQTAPSTSAIASSPVLSCRKPRGTVRTSWKYADRTS